MYNKRILLNKPLAICIILLFFGMGVVSSNGNIVEDKPFNIQVLDTVDCSEELLFSGKTAYAYIAGGSGFPEGPCCFDLDNPEDIESLGPTSSGNFLTGGTWANGWGWLACEYNTGILWSINHTTGEMNPIAGGGVGTEDIAWDDYTWKLYATNGFSFYTMDLETDEQELIGQVNILLMGIAFDNTGTLYGIGQNNDTYKLYTINISTFEETLIGPLVNFTSSWDLYMEFDKERIEVSDLKLI